MNAAEFTEGVKSWVEREQQTDERHCKGQRTDVAETVGLMRGVKTSNRSQLSRWRREGMGRVPSTAGRRPAGARPTGWFDDLYRGVLSSRFDFFTILSFPTDTWKGRDSRAWARRGPEGTFQNNRSFRIRGKWTAVPQPNPQSLLCPSGYYV